MSCQGLLVEALPQAYSPKHPFYRRTSGFLYQEERAWYPPTRTAPRLKPQRSPIFADSPYESHRRWATLEYRPAGSLIKPEHLQHPLPCSLPDRALRHPFPLGWENQKNGLKGSLKCSNYGICTRISAFLFLHPPLSPWAWSCLFLQFLSQQESSFHWTPSIRLFLWARSLFRRSTWALDMYERNRYVRLL